MQAELIVWPVLVQIFLTLIMFVLLGARKTNAMKGGHVDRQKAAINNHAWPQDVVKVSNNIQNQFQTPVLFYVLCVLFFITGGVTLLVLLVSWVFVLTRLIHAYIHVNSNFVPKRFRVFVIGCSCLFVLTGLLAAHLLI